MKKNAGNRPVISDKYLNNLFKKMLLYTHIKEHKDKFNEKIEKELNVIENELSSINNEKNRKLRQLHYQKCIFKSILDNFVFELYPYIKEKLQEIDNINFSCETLLSEQDLVVYKTGCINVYKDFNFKLTKASHKECLKENTFVKLHASLASSPYGKDYIKYLLEQLKECSRIFTGDMVDLGVNQLKKIIDPVSLNYRKKNVTVKYQDNKYDSSNIAILQKTQTIISEAEDHIISRHDSLKNYTNIYFAPDSEITTLLSVLNMDKQNLKRINSLIWENQNKIETELVKFTFKKGNLPYSSFGYASINF